MTNVSAINSQYKVTIYCRKGFFKDEEVKPVVEHFATLSQANLLATEECEWESCDYITIHRGDELVNTVEGFFS